MKNYISMNIAVVTLGKFKPEHIEPCDILAKKEKLEAFLERADDFLRCWIKIAENESETDATSELFYDLHERAWLKYKYAQEGIDACDDAYQEWNRLEGNLQFLFDSVRAETHQV